MNPLFQAHCPQRGYLTKLCDHSYCSILSVAELRRSPDQVVAPFTRSHAAYEFLLPLAPMPIILQGTDVYFGRPGMVYPVQSGVRHGQALEQCDVANISLAVSPNFMVQRLHEKGLDGAQFGPMFAVSERLRRFLRLFQEEFHGGGNPQIRGGNPDRRRHGLRLRLRRAEDHAERIHGLHAQADQRPAAQKTDSRHPAGTHHADMKR